LCVILYVAFFQFTSQLFQYNLASQSALSAPVFLIQDSGTLLIIRGVSPYDQQCARVRLTAIFATYSV